MYSLTLASSTKCVPKSGKRFVQANTRAAQSESTFKKFLEWGTEANAAQYPRFKGQTKLLINNRFVDSRSGKTFETYNPSSGEAIAKVAEADAADIDYAVDVATKAFEGPWSKMDARDRGKLLYKLADLIEQNKEELARLESLNNGKPYMDALNADLALTIDCYRYYAGWSDKMTGETIPIRGNYLCYTKREPVGVVGQIIPWNFPLLMQAWKLGPALAMGNTVVMKPAEQTPLTALRIGELIVEAGFPEGVVNILPGFGPTAGAALSRNMKVDKVAFTGSTEIGHEILKAAGDTNLKRVSLELGGKSPVIVCADADLDTAIDQTHFGLFFNQGQCCIAGSRIYVEDKIYSQFVERAAQKAKERKVGNPFEKGTQQGPQVSEEQMNKILEYVASGKADGAKLMTGGQRVGNRGYFVEPTVFADVKDEMKISKEEIFGPVMSISKFSSLDEVVKRSNNSIYGLGAAIFTKNVAKAHSLASKIRAGTVYVNCYDVFDAAAPFGGYKQSGNGRELGKAALDLYTEIKTVIVPTM